ncbi:hypothetical protein LZ518_13010 [Sphingomonas sp. RB56-2]|uniref:Uncharacterized protein n=1 Tax=Sphingomonas brevis TaxID=2908206 RepID=A0ABT0SD16_9SPHN|nr:hypothetical protein [Sphingomonas brevis]MCL6742049.1 hypothetical protein [Sphingomonas brevis]
MRTIWIALPLMLAATPAAAAPKDIQVPREFSDPAMADKLGKMAGILTRALMDMPVGEVEAAVQGREPTTADRAKRVRDEIGGPQAERQVEAQVAQSGRQMQAVGQALVESLPSLMSALGDLESRMERVTANIPDPTYPKR